MSSVSDPGRVRIPAIPAMAALGALGLSQAMPAQADTVLASGVTLVSGTEAQP